MPVILRGELSVSEREANNLWKEIFKLRNFSDDEVVVKVVSEEGIRDLNNKYRGKDEATNVLTFSYGGEHDVVMCLEIAKREAREREVSIKNYTAWLLVHAFLHATGVDHERSEKEAGIMRDMERTVLDKHGFIYPVH